MLLSAGLPLDNMLKASCYKLTKIISGVFCNVVTAAFLDLFCFTTFLIPLTQDYVVAVDSHKWLIMTNSSKVRKRSCPTDCLRRNSRYRLCETNVPCVGSLKL